MPEPFNMGSGIPALFVKERITLWMTGNLHSFWVLLENHLTKWFSWVYFRSDYSLRT